MLALMGSRPMRRFDAVTKLLPWVTSTKFGMGRNLDETSRRAYHAGLSRTIDAFHVYLGEALHSEALFQEVSRALSGPFRRLPLLTIFGERNDPLKFQPQWKRLFPSARQVVIPKGNHFPMCDDPDRVANAISDWHHEFIFRTGETRQ
jgi:haloalkane dehalogenase